MKNVLLLKLAFLLGFASIAGYQYIQINRTTAPTLPPSAAQPTPQPTFALVPPAQAVAGVLTIIKGKADKFSRGETEYKEASTGAQILTGESIATKENSAATATVGDIVTVTLAEKAELVFANMFPTNAVFQQKTGKIDYHITKPIAVRALHALLSADAADVTINIIDTDMSITVKTGLVKFALVDNDNNTNIWNLKAGTRANIDDAARSVFLVKAR